MLTLPLSEQQARKKLQQILNWNRERLINYNDTNLHGDLGPGFIEYNITRMYYEFGGIWDGHRATEYINSLAAENDFGKISLRFEQG